MTDFDEIFQRLGLNRQNGLYVISEDNWKTDVAFPNRVKRLIERKIKPYAVFCFDNKPLLLFFDTPEDQKELHQAIWNFNECPIAIIINNNVVEVYNGFNYSTKTNLLEKLGGVEKLNDFGYFELVTGKTWEQYQDQLNYENRVDFQLLKNIKAARKLLLSADESKARIANSILGKVIFVRYLIDRKVRMKFGGTLCEWTNEEFCELLKDRTKAKAFFDYLEDKEKGFNGELFPLTNDEYGQITNEDFQVLRRLLSGEDIGNEQPSLFEFYDFSIIPIEFISNIYELFIGQDNQKKEGAYYTPLFLVDYILKETVEKKLSENDFDYNCKVLDPACGSGIFLVETLRKIIEKYIKVTNPKANSRSFKTTIAKLVEDNIFGIDKDLSAVQVAIFSTYLTLLDYLEPADIEDAFKFPNLLNTNFFEADFFDTESLFNQTLQDLEFNFILGNPPWKVNGMDETGKLYLSNRKKNEKKTQKKKFPIAINKYEISEGFVLRVSDFCREITKISLIIHSSSLYNRPSKKEQSPFRLYWLEEFFVDKVFELAPVRKEVFEGSNGDAIAPAAVVFYRYANGQATDDNTVEHIVLKKSRFFSLFKIFTINRNDYKKVTQKKLKEFDWLWKILVYGSYLDFNFIKRLKEQYPSVKNTILSEKNVIEGTGIKYGRGSKDNSQRLIGEPFLDVFGLNTFYIDPAKISPFLSSEAKRVERIRDPRLFKSPMLLVREGLDMETLTAKCAVSKKDVLFKDSITSIKAIDTSDVEVLENIAGIYSTSLFSYYAVNMFASIGIERERAKNYNKYSLPYLKINVKESIEKIEKAKLEISTNEEILSGNRNLELEDSIQSELNSINAKVLEKLEVDSVETALIDYALEVNRTLIIGDDSQKNTLFSSLVFEDKRLNDYASIFLNRFKKSLDSDTNKFTIEIWHTNQIVGMFFKMIPANEYVQEIKWESKQNNAAFLTFLFQMGANKITDQLFVQKDIRGFDNNGNDFYIIKPNEKRLWHEAIAYLDVNEFADAILKAEREK